MAVLTSDRAGEAEQRPVGAPVDAAPARRPDDRELFGRTVTLEPVAADRHAADLWRSFADSDAAGRLWTYMAYGPFAGLGAFTAWVEKGEAARDPRFYAIVPRATAKPAGMAAYMRITPEHRVIEIGNIWFAPALQKTREATDAIFVLMRHAFDELGYRRLEWKCDALNAASRRAAVRLGFTFEGVFRRHMIIKGRNRDTAWYAITDADWPRLRAAFEAWLGDDNFDAAGRQRKPLAAFIKPGAKPQPRRVAARKPR